MTRPAICALVALLTLVGLSAAPCAAGETDEAIRLYEAGDYTAARALIEPMDADGRADGAMLYRLYFCQQTAGDPAARDTLGRARERLEAEVETSDDLAVPFYLSNIYGNIGKLSDRTRVASRATGRLESGELPEPTTALDLFRVGKLYADQEKAEAAEIWYGRALDAFAEQSDSAPPAYVIWAARSLGTKALESGELAAAERHLSLVAELPDAQVSDLDRLAVARVRLGKYTEAARAWNRAELLAPASGDRARYCKNLARQAFKLGELPATAPDGREWSALTKEELESTMLEQATAARQRIAAAVEAGPILWEARREIDASIVPLRASFVAAGLEYALRGHGIREAAFFGGYAPLIFREREWRLPPPPPEEPASEETPEAG